MKTFSLSMAAVFALFSTLGFILNLIDVPFYLFNIALILFFGFLYLGECIEEKKKEE